MQQPTNQSPVREYRLSPTAVQALRVAIAVIFIAIGVALSPFSIPVFGARIYPLQSFLNVLGAAFLGPVYTLLVALIVSIIRNATGLGTPLAYLGSMIGALLAALAYRAVMSGGRPDERRAGVPVRLLLAALAAAAGEIVGTGILAALLDGAIVAPVVLHKAVVFTIYLLPFLFAAVTGGLAAAIIIVLLWRAGVRPRTDQAWL
jgi:energy coupling factor transporter S component ThiW